MYVFTHYELMLANIYKSVRQNCISYIPLVSPTHLLIGLNTFCFVYFPQTRLSLEAKCFPNYEVSFFHHCSCLWMTITLHSMDDNGSCPNAGFIKAVIVFLNSTFSGK